MNLRQLRSLTNILQHGSFAAAGDKVGLSHSAISVQMQQLETDLGGQLFDRSHRPVTLTPEGQSIAELANEVLEKLETMKQIGRGEGVITRVSIGIIPTCVHNLLPRILTALRDALPDLQVKVQSGLSGELAAAVVRREIDYALITTPVIEMPELKVNEVAAEPFYAIGPANLRGLKSDRELVQAMPYIAFSHRTWVGQQIAARLQQRGIHVNQAIEIDSLQAIENLVAEGFGVSIVPRLLHAKLDQTNLVHIPFTDPPPARSKTPDA